MMMSAEVECKKIPQGLICSLSHARRPLPPSLHALGLYALLLALHVPARHTGAQPAPQVERSLSQQDRAALLARVRLQVAELSREPSYPPGVHPVGSRATLGRGLWLSPRLILTAEAWLARAPAERSVTISLKRTEALDGVKSPTLSTLHRSPKSGLALLALTALPSGAPLSYREHIQEATRALKARGATLPQALSAPRTLWALSELTPTVTPVMLLGRGAGAEAYYWSLSAPMRWGDPLFNDSGEWVGLSCSRGRLLPPDSVRALLDELAAL